MKRLLALLAVFALGVVTFQAHTHGRASANDAQAMVQKAVAYYKAHGREKALAAFVDPSGPFAERDLYVAVHDLRAEALAEAPRLNGKNMMQARDADGRLYVRERLEIATTRGNGWHAVKLSNPVTNRVEPRRVYFEIFDDLVFACGAYSAS